MLQGTYTAALGIASHQARLDTIANNLANVSTNGYKTVRTDFKDALYKTMTRADGQRDDLNMEKGHGLLVGATRRIYTQGTYQETGIDTNVLIEGEGYFTVQSSSGEIYYTRDGSFGRSVEGDDVYLVTSDGNYVLDQNGQRIALRNNDFQVHSDGTITQSGQADVYAVLGIVRFPNDEGLEAVSNNLFAVSDASGAPEPANMGRGGDTQLVQGAVEGSNVELSDEFARLVRASRAMQLSSRALTMADEMDGTATSIRR